MATIKNFSYRDLEPLLDEAKANSDYLWQQNINYELNVKRRVLPHEPKEWAMTTAELAGRGNRAAQRKIKKAEKETDKIIAQNQDILQKYRDETNRRNQIVNRMAELRWIMKARWNSDTKNRLAWTNMVRDSIKEYNQLKQEANKFLKYIKL